MIELPDRWLTERGISICDPRSPIFRRLARTPASGFRVTELTPEIVEFNRFADAPITEPTSADFKADPPQVVLPAPYTTLDVDTYVTARFSKATRQLPHEERASRLTVVMDELDWFFEHNKYDMLRTLVYVVDTLMKNKIPWGVGRGSSVNSYVLYLIGVHNIDPIQYNLDWREFMR